MVLTPAQLDLCRQWFNIAQDTSRGYLLPQDYELATLIYLDLGMRVPDSLQNRGKHTRDS